MRSNQRYRSRRRRELGSIKSSSLKLDFISDALDSRITYTGGFNRTKYDANGVLGHAPHNLYMQSENLGTTWAFTRMDKSLNVIANPIDGAVTADGLIASSDDASHSLLQGDNYDVLEAGGTYTFSAYLKAGDQDWASMAAVGWSSGYAAQTLGVSQFFDLANGTIGSIVTGQTGGDIDSTTITAVGDDGWYRASMTVTIDAGIDITLERISIEGSDGDRDRVFAGDDVTVTTYVWGIQGNKGPLTDYVATTTAAVWEPRFDHVLKARTNHIRNNTMQGAVDATPGNLLLQSQTFGTTWVKTTGTALNENVVNGPFGTTTADELEEGSTSSTQHRFAQHSVTLLDATQYTLSVYVKRGVGSRHAQLGLSGSGSQIRIYYDLGLGTVVTQTNGTGTITDVGGGWFRLAGTGTTNQTGNSIYLAITEGTSLADETYDGDGTSSMYFWGAQLEAKPYVDTYVATTGSAVATSFGTSPTNWSTSFTGATVKVVGTGTENGIEYIDYRFAGTPTSDGYIDIDKFNIEALTGEVWAQSVYFSIVDGDTTNLAAIKIYTTELTEGNVSVRTNFSGSLTITSTLTRYVNAHTLSGGSTTAKLNSTVFLDWDGSGAVDITLRIGLPQMERAAAATESIKTYGGAVTVDEWRDHNLALQSSDFTTTWTTRGDATVTADQIANPINGVADADLVTTSAGGANSIEQTVTVNATDIVTFNAYVKTNDATHINFRLIESSGADAYYDFQFSDGAITSATADTLNNTAIALDDGWYRVSITTLPENAGVWRLRAGGEISASSTGTKFYIYGAQLTKGTELLDYTATVATAVAATLEYVPVGLSVFEARTNQILQSQDFGTTWDPARATIGATKVIAPDGTLTGHPFAEDDTEDTDHHIDSASMLPDGDFTNDATYTWSCYVKAINRNWVRFTILDKGGAYPGGEFDVERGVVGPAGTSGNVSTIENVGNGWYRCAMSRDIGTGTSDPRFHISIGSASNTTVFDGQDQDSLYIWGAQVEKGAFPTPYVKTTTATVPATADITTMSDVSWLTQGVGTMFVEFTAPALSDARYVIYLNETGGTYTDNMGIQFKSDNNIKFAGEVGDSSQFSVQTGSAASGTNTFKVAAAWVTTSVQFARDGTLGTEDPSSAIPTIGEFDIGTRSTIDHISGNIALIEYWPFRKSDKFLTEITS